MGAVSASTSCTKNTHIQPFCSVPHGYGSYVPIGSVRVSGGNVIGCAKTETLGSVEKPVSVHSFRYRPHASQYLPVIGLTQRPPEEVLRYTALTSGATFKFAHDTAAGFAKVVFMMSWTNTIE